MLNSSRLIANISSFRLLHPHKTWFCQTFSSGATMDRSYQSAIDRLNSLQTNASILAALEKSGGLLNQRSIPEMVEFLERMELKPEDLDSLNFIHVAGTKGKGSTCCMVERILRECGYKTGLYTSPHMLEARERIRINGEPLSRQEFADYFYQVWDMFTATKEIGDKYGHGDYPGYFRFLTLLAFHVFRDKRVDATILEVGIGGEYDATNVIVKPIVCGITSLGYDHQVVLGNTLGEIAWHKAGIFKPNVPALTCQQLPEAEKVVVERAQERKTPLALSPSLQQEEFPISLGLEGLHQWQNAGLAVDLARLFIQQTRQENLAMTPSIPLGSSLTPLQPSRTLMPSETRRQFLKGLTEARWPGRAQTITTQKTHWHLDGAHTPESLQVCADWYRQIANPSKGKHVLVFNCTSGRSGLDLLKPLVQLQREYQCWDTVIFSALHVGDVKDFQSKVNKSDKELTVQRALAEDWKTLSSLDYPQPKIHLTSSVQEAVKLIEEMGDDIHVLVTGSLHLVGNTMSAISAPVS